MMPIQYRGILAEHAWTRSSVSVFDTCHMGQFLIEGDADDCGLERVVCRRLGDAPVGACRYGLFLNEDGGIVDDLIACRLGPRRWLLVVNAGTCRRDEEYLSRFLADPSCVKNLTGEVGKIDVQGPLSRSVLEDLFGLRLSSLRFYQGMTATVLGAPAVVTRTGYTGEPGYEISVPAEKVVAVWERLLSDERVRPAGLGARDTLRLEMAYPLSGQDIDEAHTPLQAGLERFVEFGKEFVGRQALLRQKASGVRERLTCFSSLSRRAPRHGQPVYAGGQRIGFVTSGSFSPTLGHGIGMGYLTRWQEGMPVTAGEGSAACDAVIVTKPFLKKGV